MKRGRTTPATSGDEHDAFSRWRHVLCVFHNVTGVAKKAKRRYNKRDRRVTKAYLEAYKSCRCNDGQWTSDSVHHHATSTQDH